MKKTNRIFLGVGLTLSLATLTGCIEETFPLSSMATEEQVQESPTSTEAMALGMPAKALSIWDDASQHSFFGLPAHMIMRDMMTGDYLQSGSGIGYGWHFYYWAQNKNMGDGFRKTQFTWNFYWGFLLSVNNVIGAVNPDNATDEQLGYLGSALAYRALIYLDLARMYEFLPNDIFPDGKNSEGMTVTGLTVPIVTEATPASEARKNPRAPHEKMSEFILSDLDNAEKYIVNLTDTKGNVLPDLACVYGLKALSTTNGMNTAADFMWAGQQTSEDRTVTTGIVNWTSWASNQTDFGYTGAATKMFLICDAKFYERISNTDWRKLWFQAPEGSPLRAQIPYMNPTDAAGLVPYASIKFRPAQGNISAYATGAASAYPVMRVEEMYFIEAEATAQSDPAAGLTLVKNFMSTYRDPNYASKASTKEAVVNEIVFQKQVELWGEGQRFFDVKRLNLSVTRGYKDTPFYSQFRLNTNGRPAWTNLVISRNEVMNNDALLNLNNPDPSDKYPVWTEE